MAAMTPAERLEFDAAVNGYAPLFVPSEGPQTDAYNSDADIIGYGGAAGGGKSALIRGLATTAHTRSLIIRQEKTTTRKFVQDIALALGSRDGYSSQTSSWQLTGPDGAQRVIEFAGMENEGDEEKQQGVDYDLKAYDEATQMRESQVRYTVGWARTTIPGQRVRVIMTFNPPTTAEGRWVVRYFAPWLDAKHPRPAKDGELRWFTTVGDNADYEVEGPEAFVILNGKPCYQFDPDDYAPEDIVTPMSRTFFHAKLADNPYLVRDGAYLRQLQQLPPTLRAQMLKGDFMAGIEDPADQVIPTAWIEAAMARWQPREARGEMTSMGVDAARGGNSGSSLGATGKDKMVIARRHGQWFAPLVSIKGVDVNDGFLAASQVIRFRTDHAPAHIDVVGIGASPYDVLKQNNVHTVPINGAAKSLGTDASGLLPFFNLRAELHWRLREALDPKNPNPIALPDDQELLADLAAPTWWLGTRGIQVESKDDIKERLKRSPDKGDAVIYALVDTPKLRYAVDGFLGFEAAGTASSYDDDRFKVLSTGG
ncbi:MAG TPA: terminase [Sphingomonas sp.]|jgi:hypothetical protein